MSGIKGGAFKAFAVQFENVSGGQLKIKSLLTTNGDKRSKICDSAADQIWRWNTAESHWDKYFHYYDKNYKDNAGWCKEGEVLPTEETIGSGETFFFRRSTSDKTADGATLTLAGGVREFAGQESYAMKGGELAFMGYPWPIEMKVTDMFNYIPSSLRKRSKICDSAADQIWRWNTAENHWDKYFHYYDKNFKDNEGWCKEGETTPTKESIPAGEGFFFRRSTSDKSTEAQVVVTFTPPAS